MTALAIDDELLLPVLERRLDNPGMAVRPVIAVGLDRRRAPRGAGSHHT